VEECCRHVDDLDLKQEYLQRVNDLRLRLKEKGRKSEREAGKGSG